MRIRLRLCAITLSVLAAAAVATAQTPPLEHSVHGKVTDALTGKPLPAAHISIPGRHYATVTNSDGIYTIKSDEPITSLVFSHLGYKTLTEKVTSPELNVKMETGAIMLDQSVIVSGNALDLVKAAISRIHVNYPDNPQLLRCFYRETVRKRQRYTYISEAVSRVYKTDYGKGIYQDRTALEKSRVLLSQRSSDTLSVKLMGGPTIATEQDAVKNTEMLLNDTDLSYYRFEVGNPTVTGDRMQYVVHFTPGPVKPSYPLYEGTLYIDSESLAFTRMEISLDMSDPFKATQMMLVKKPLTLRFTPKELSAVISFRSQDDGRYRLEYIRTTIGFNCDWKKRVFATTYTAVNELVVTDMIEPATPIARQEAFRAADILYDKAPDFFDPDFWKDYNIIEPTESLEHAIGHLMKKAK